MKRLTISISLFFVLFQVCLAQVETDFHGTLNVYATADGGGGIFLIEGIFNHSTGLYHSSESQVGDVLYMNFDDNCTRYVINSISQNSGNVITCVVQDLEDNTDDFPQGLGAIVRETENNQYPIYVDGISNDLLACIRTHFTELVDLSDSQVQDLTFNTSTNTIGLTLSDVEIILPIDDVNFANTNLVADSTRLHNWNFHSFRMFNVLDYRLNVLQSLEFISNNNIVFETTHMSTDVNEYHLNVDNNIDIDGGSATIDGTDNVSINSAITDLKSEFIRLQNIPYSNSSTNLIGYDSLTKRIYYVDIQTNNTDNQTLILSANQLSISNGNTIDLSAYLDNTDSQNLTLVNGILSISDGNSVDINTVLDDNSLSEEDQVVIDPVRQILGNNNQNIFYIKDFARIETETKSGGGQNIGKIFSQGNVSLQASKSDGSRNAKLNISSGDGIEFEATVNSTNVTGNKAFINGYTGFEFDLNSNSDIYYKKENYTPTVGQKLGVDAIINGRARLTFIDDDVEDDRNGIYTGSDTLSQITTNVYGLGLRSLFFWDVKSFWIGGGDFELNNNNSVKVTKSNGTPKIQFNTDGNYNDEMYIGAKEGSFVVSNSQNLDTTQSALMIESPFGLVKGAGRIKFHNAYTFPNDNPDGEGLPPGTYTMGFDENGNGDWITSGSFAGFSISDGTNTETIDLTNNTLLFNDGIGLKAIVSSTNEVKYDLAIDGLIEDGLINVGDDLFAFYDESTQQHKSINPATLITPLANEGVIDVIANAGTTTTLAPTGNWNILNVWINDVSSSGTIIQLPFAGANLKGKEVRIFAGNVSGNSVFIRVEGQFANINNTSFFNIQNTDDYNAYTLVMDRLASNWRILSTSEP